uniref:Uncharacterized protein n=1 Tax=Anguilla anguilla TaxID=7936 RepID=A0A0E9QSG7_ANGAN
MSLFRHVQLHPPPAPLGHCATSCNLLSWHCIITTSFPIEDYTGYLCTTQPSPLSHRMAGIKLFLCESPFWRQCPNTLLTYRRTRKA